jgi:hypothetical protein
MTLADLHKPFPAAEIEWRVGSTNGDKTSGLALAYLTARHVMDRLDAVCGSQNWQDRYEFHGARTVCYLSIRIGDEWVTKADGAGDSDVEAEKGAISDALKRAAVKWGIGRYLYDLGNIWVDTEPAGRSVRIKRDQYKKLQDALNKQFGEGLSAAAPAVPEQPAAPPPPAAPPARLTGGDGAAKLNARITADLKAAAAISTSRMAEVWKANMPDIKRLPEKMEFDLIDLKEALKASALASA